jgi:tape measure domain-containing protein
VPRYQLDILITGTDRASPTVNRFGGALGRIAQIAGGILIAGAIRGITDQIGDLGRTAVEAYSDLEKMQVGLESLIARELARGDVVEETVTSIRHLTEEELLDIDRLVVKYGELGDELEGLKEDHQEAIDEFGEGSWQALKYAIAIKDVTKEMQDVQEEMGEMQSLEGRIIATTTKNIENQISLAEALKLAREPARQLTDWIVKLSLVSPFEENDITMALRVAAGYGFITQHASDAATEEERLNRARDDGVVTAQRLTVALLDLLAAIGLPSENLARIVLALGQVRATGKLLAQEIRQLINAGVGLDIMALAMGMTVEEFMAAQKQGKILAEDFLPALVKLLEDDLAGSAERVMQTFGGALISLQKFRRVALREFFGPTFELLTPMLLEFYRNVSSEDNLNKIRRWGTTLANTVENMIGFLQDLQDKFDEVKVFMEDPITLSIAGIDANLPSIFADPLTEGLEGLQELNLQLGFVDGNAAAAQGALKGLALMFGVRGGIGLIKRLAPGIIGAILGIGSGIGWIGVAASLAGAAWQGNFLGIRDITNQVWEESIQPFINNIMPWLEENLPLAVQTARDAWNNELVPAFQNLVLWINEEGIPALETFAVNLINDAAQGAADLAVQFDTEVLPKFITLGEKLNNEIIPGFIETARLLKEDVANAASTAGDVLFGEAGPLGRTILEDTVNYLLTDWLPTAALFAFSVGDDLLKQATIGKMAIEEIIGPTITTIYENVRDDVVPIFEKFLGFFLKLRDDAAVAVKDAWETVIQPALQGLWEFFEDHIIPAIEAFVDLFLEIEEFLVRIFGGLWVNIVLPKLEEFWDLFFENINPAIDFFLSIIISIEEWVSGKFGNALKWLADEILPRLANFAQTVADAIDAIAEAARNTAAALDEMELPWWALPEHSPPAAHRFFMEIAEAIGAVDEAATQSQFLHGRAGFGLARQFTVQRVDSGGVQYPMQPVTIQGDTNTFYVTDEQVGALVAHLIAEEKLKRFNESMGRI